MILISLVLLVAGFFFSPAWLALAGYGIYLFFSRKSRRVDAVESRIKKLVLANKEFAVFKDLYFEAARSYAIAKGAQSPEKDAASATVVIDSRVYFVTFMRDPSGGTAISARDKRAVEREFESDLQGMLSKVETYPNGGDSTFKGGVTPSEFVDSFFEYVYSIKKTKFDSESEKPSWVREVEKVKELSAYIMAESTRHGVAPSYAAAMLLQAEFVSVILACIAAAESQGFDLEFQKDTGAAIISRAWGRLSLEYQIKFIDMPLSEEVIEALTDMNGS